MLLIWSFTVSVLSFRLLNPTKRETSSKKRAIDQNNEWALNIRKIINNNFIINTTAGNITFLIDMGTEENTQGRSLLHCAQDYSEIKTPGCIVSALLKCEKGPMMLK